MMKFWDYQVNPSPYEIPRKSNNKYWWICPACDHRFERICFNMASSTSCPECNKVGITRRVSDVPRLIAQWSPNNKLNPRTVSLKHKSRLLWFCGKGHEYKAFPPQAESEDACGICKKESIILEKAPWLYQEYAGEDFESEYYGKNLLFWKCRTCSFEWNALLSNRLKGTGCPECNRNNHASNQVSRSLARNGSVADNERLLSQWSLKNKVDPSQVSAVSIVKYEWICEIGHSWVTTPGLRSGGQNCPFCTAKESTNRYREEKALAGKSFGHLYPELVATVSPGQDIDFFKILTGSHLVVTWSCESCSKEWDAPVGRRANGSGCPHCWSGQATSRGEKELGSFIESLGYSIERNNKQLLRGKEIDVYVPELKIGFEYNGNYWHSEARISASKNGRTATQVHQEKLILAENAEVALFYVWEDDWLSGAATDWIESALAGEAPSQLLVLSKG